MRTSSVLLGQHGDQGRVTERDGQRLIATLPKEAQWEQAEGFILMGQQGREATLVYRLPFPGSSQNPHEALVYLRQRGRTRP